MNTLLLVSIGLGLLGQTELPDWPPLPKEGEHVDYIKWYDDARRAGMKPEDDAFPLYRKIMPTIDDSDGKRPDKFRFSGFRHADPFPEGFPRPWNPKDQPDWEASYQRTKPALEQFIAAASRPYFFLPNRFAMDSSKTGPLFIYLLEPALAEFRTYAKGLSEAAWRAPGGHIDGGRFLKCVRGALGAARQVEQEPLLLSQLVGYSIRTIVYDDIQRALYAGALSTDTIQKLQSDLGQFDGPIPPIELGLRCECACWFDSLQYLASHPENLSEPKFIPVAIAIRHRTLKLKEGATDIREYFKTLSELFAMKGIQRNAAKRKLIARIRELERVAPAIHEWQTGFDRANELRLKTESYQFATRLILAMQLHHMKDGSWPRSLSQLPAEVSPFQTDPLADRPFVYRLVKGEPTLYSVSRNGRDDSGVHDSQYGEARPDTDFVYWPPQPIRANAGARESTSEPSRQGSKD